MKILKLALKNINSLYGAWEIDFTDPAYAGGLFAITGKTGSGKTTLLDAMMLALYAETPRIPSGRNVEVVSRGAQDCLAELTFAAHDGHIYTASFSFGSYLRGPKKGQINEKYLHRLAKDGIEIADHTASVRKCVEEVTGLDKSRFCRTVMLAQGQFDAFLGAGDEKAPILERITGTEIYTRIAAAVKERNDQENTAYGLLQKECEQTSVLSPEDELEKQNTYESLKQAVAALQQKSEQLTNRKRIMEEQARIKAALLLNEQNRTALTAEMQAFQPQAERLALAEKAEPLREPVQKLETLKRENLADSAETADLTEKLPVLREQRQKTECKRTELAELLRQKTAEREQFLATLKQVRKLDDSLREKSGRLCELNAEILAIQKDILELLAGKNTAEQSLEKLSQENEADIRLCREEDPALPEKAARWQESLKHIASLKKIGTDAAAERKKAETACRSALTELEQKAAEQKITAAALPPLQEQVSGLRELIRNMESRNSLERQKETLLRNMAFIRKIMDLEAERHLLRDGSPCPLCGALAHPYAGQYAALPEQQQNESELKAVQDQLDNLTVQEERLKTAEDALHKAEEADRTAKHQHELAGQRADAAAQHSRETAERHEALRTEYSSVVGTLKLELRENGMEWIDTEVLPPSLGTRLAALQAASARLEQFERNKQELQNRLLLTESRLRDSGKLLTARQEQAELITREQDALRTERKQLFGEKDPDAENTAVENAWQSLIRMEQESGIALTQISKDLEYTENRLEKLRSSLEQRTAEIRQTELLYQEKCRDLGLDHTASCPILPPDELARLAAQKAEFAARQKNLTSEQELLTAELSKITLPENTDALRYDELSQLLDEIKNEWQQKTIAVGALQNELQQNQENKKRLAEKHAALEQQKEKINLWGRLYQLIGKGNQFQRIAQGITLDNLLTLANEELIHLYSRYELIRSGKTPLGIDVIDHEQGDEIRSCDNLSGGERFVVSLSLALGLSRMAGERIRVDSLFLDEGFGTLDAESLQLVMQALSKLKSDGKTVGIISHVSGLADEIACNLELISAGGGRSLLTGPGVTAL